MSTIVRSSAENRGDKNLAARLEEEYKSIASWLQFRPYTQFPPFEPSSRVVAPYFYDAIIHSTFDSYWKTISVESHYDQIKVTVLSFDGWYDSFLEGSLKNFVGMRSKGATSLARVNQRIVIGPWDHIGWGRPDSVECPRLKALGSVANSPVNELTLAWFEHFLKDKDNGVRTGPRVDYFEMGENRWHSSDSWPISGTEFQKWYLASGSHANSVMGDGVLRRDTSPMVSAPEDQFEYLPWNPAPSVGGHSCCDWTQGPQGQFDQSSIEQRGDVLVYSSSVLTRPIEVTGPVSVLLYARSSARDTDFTAKLVDVFPDGSAINLNNGIQQARFRNSLSEPSLITPNQIYEYTIQIWPTSNMFRIGHLIRLEISSSDFPQFAPNPNTGERFGSSARWQFAHQSIVHDQTRPSALVLPVVPPGASGGGSDRPPES